MNDELRGEICGMISELFGVEREQISRETTQGAIEGWDSLQHLNLVLDLEARFDVRLDPEQVEAMSSVEAIVRVLREKLDG